MGVGNSVSDALMRSIPNNVRLTVKGGAKLLWKTLDEGLTLAPRIIFATWWREGRHHAAPIDPLRIIPVDPRTINHWVDMEATEYRRIRYHFGVRAGSWDLETVPLDEHFVYTSLKARFQHGADWSDTLLYSVAMAGIKEGSSRYHGCRTLSDLERRLAFLDELYARIEHAGYRTQAKERRSDRDTHGVRHARPAALDEVVVHVGREGQFLLVDGVHRFSIARLQGIASIPVIVLLRHAQWQDHRNAIVMGRYDAGSLESHPDLVGLDRRC